MTEEECEHIQPALEATPEVETDAACQTDLPAAQVIDLGTQFEGPKLTIQKL